MQAHGCKAIVFSSSASVYGQPRSLPVREDAALEPSSPYASSKLMSENILRDLERVRSDLAGRPAALLQPGGGAPERHDRRRPVRHAEQPDALRRPGGGGQAPATADLRQRLRDARRQRGARLPPCAGPGRGACRRPEAPHGRRRIADREPRHRPGRQRPRAGAGVRAGQRPAASPTTSLPGGRATSPPATPTRPWPSGCSAGRPGSAWRRCAPTAGAGRRPTRTATRPADPTAGPSPRDGPLVNPLKRLQLKGPGRARKLLPEYTEVTACRNRPNLPLLAGIRRGLTWV